MYDQFDEPVPFSDIKKYDVFYQNMFSSDDSGKNYHVYFCRKLLRNLESVCNVRNNIALVREQCKNLNKWLFYQIKPYKLTEDIINKIFNLLKHLPNEIINPEYCSYYSYNVNIKDSGNMIKLDNFVDNIPTIRSILKNSDPSKYC